MTFRYQDVIELEAKDEKEAEKIAIQMSEPQYHAHLDTIVKELS